MTPGASGSSLCAVLDLIEAVGERIPRPVGAVLLALGCVLVTAAVVGLPVITVVRLAGLSVTDPDPAPKDEVFIIFEPDDVKEG